MMNKSQLRGQGWVGDKFRQGYQWFANNVLSENKNKGQLQLGEIHIPQLVYDKGLKVKPASYAGPGSVNNPSQDLQLIKQGKTKAISQADRASMAHDYRYSLAKNAQDVRNADNKMLQSLKNTMFTSPTDFINNAIAYAGIKGKTVLEDIGIVNQNTFTKPGSNGADDQKLRDTEELVQHLEMQGYGKGGHNSYQIQSILIKKSVPAKIREKIVHDIGGHISKVDITKSYARYRQKPPGHFKTFRVKKINDKVKLVLGFH